MVDTPGQQPSTQNQTPSQVFPLPGYKGSIAPHGGTELGGSDIFAPVGTPIVSMVTGKVVFTSTQSTAPNSGGNSVEILGQDGLSYYYAHMLNPVGLKNGDTVLAGQSLGAVDNTGNAATTPSHLHIGIGKGISTGTGAPGGIGLGGFDAVSYLRSLESNPRANNPDIVGGTPNPPQIQFNPSVPGFDSAHLADIQLNLQEALKAGIDPFLWLGIVSKESNFDPNAVNPKSGACGYAQIYPCVSGLTPQQNIQEGIKRLQGFLSSCNGNVNCALNLYSGGGGPLYASDVQNRGAAIQSSNPDISSGNFSIPTIGGSVGTTGGIQTNVVGTDQCPAIKLGKVGPWDISFPDPTCIVRKALQNMVSTLTNWWKQWQGEHVPNWTFVALGIVLIIVGGLAIANQSGASMPNMPSKIETEAPVSGEAAEALAFA